MWWLCFIITWQLLFNSLRANDAYMHQQPRTSLVQIKASRLFGAKPLSEPMLEYCQWDPWEHKLQFDFNRNLYIFIWKKHLKMSSGKCQPICFDLNVLMGFRPCTQLSAVCDWVLNFIISTKLCCTNGSKSWTQLMWCPTDRWYGTDLCTSIFFFS